MPKVNIYEPNRHAIDVETNEPVPVQQRRVSVGWAKGTHAQLGVGWVDEEATAKVGRETGWSADYLVGAELDERQRVWCSQWIELDRHAINQLIRELRKARDDAFGRDE